MHWLTRRVLAGNSVVEQLAPGCRRCVDRLLHAGNLRNHQVVEESSPHVCPDSVLTFAGGGAAARQRQAARVPPPLEATLQQEFGQPLLFDAVYPGNPKMPGCTDGLPMRIAPSPGGSSSPPPPLQCASLAEVHGKIQTARVSCLLISRRARWTRPTCLQPDELSGAHACAELVAWARTTTPPPPAAAAWVQAAWLKKLTAGQLIDYFALSSPNEMDRHSCARACNASLIAEATPYVPWPGVCDLPEDAFPLRHLPSATPAVATSGDPNEPGRDPTGRDRTGRDPTGRDRTSRDRTSRDRTSRDRTSRASPFARAAAAAASSPKQPPKLETPQATDSEGGRSESPQPLAIPRVAPAGSLLVGVVADSQPPTRARACANVEVLSKGGWLLDWAVVAFDDQSAQWVDVAACAERQAVSLWVRDGGWARSGRFVGKHTHQWRFLVAAAEQHSALWLIDADVSFATFDMAAFVRGWHCAFDSGPPLIAQPVSRQNAQEYWTSNLNAYQTGGVLGAVYGEVVGLKSPYVEIQAPLIDAAFLHWLYGQLGGFAFVAKQMELGTDWGLDVIWCGAAKDYARTRRLHRTPCGVLAVPFDHDDDRVIEKSFEFEQRGLSMHAWAKEQWPSWFLHPKATEGLLDPAFQIRKQADWRRQRVAVLRLIDRLNATVRRVDEGCARCLRRSMRSQGGRERAAERAAELAAERAAERVPPFGTSSPMREDGSCDVGGREAGVPAVTGQLTLSAAATLRKEFDRRGEAQWDLLYRRNAVFSCDHGLQMRLSGSSEPVCASRAQSRGRSLGHRRSCELIPGAQFVTRGCMPADHPACQPHLRWAKAEGIKKHPNWYPGLSATSPDRNFLVYLAKSQPHTCGLPCEGPQTDEGSGAMALPWPGYCVLPATVSLAPVAS